ncbi:hypothetical protein L4C34_11825 [Vibrio profundum]|uniref:hypothetical protein n=1 Tax=Vibrio profundum TaxID=2910247 RepID=UPI003D12A724
MTQRNIHGNWTMNFENRILQSKITGSTNTELSQAWFEDMKCHLSSSEDNYMTPWVNLFDFRDWDLTTIDSFGNANDNIHWMSENNCILLAFVFSKKMQHFAMEKGLSNNGIVRFFFDYGEAYQACLDKLEGAQRQQDK